MKKNRVLVLIMTAVGALMPSVGVTAGGALMPSVGVAERAPDPGLPSASCGHPYPCGDEWPDGLEGPFELREVQRVQVTSHDGEVLDGWLSFPELPPGVRAPVLLNVSSYLESCQSNGVCYRPPSRKTADGTEEPDWDWWDENDLQYDTWDVGLGIHPIHWIRRGYIHAQFSARGTGASGGCFEFGAQNEQRDMKVLVDWLAAKERESEWPGRMRSNGRVGIGGLSYGGWTALQAATQAPRALKAILSVSPVVDLYELLFSPQGVAALAHSAVAWDIFHEDTTRLGAPLLLLDPLLAPDPLLPPDPVLPSPERAVCPEMLAEDQELAQVISLNRRTESFYEKRNLAPLLNRVTAAVLHVQGYNDIGHHWVDRTLTASLPRRVPVRELRNWMKHEYPTGIPNPNVGGLTEPTPVLPFDPPGADASWADTELGWFDYWLKGRGPEPRLQVDAMDQDETWHESGDRWPPRRSRDEVLYLASGALSGTPGGESATFHAAHNLETAHLVWAATGAGISDDPFEENGLGRMPVSAQGASLCGDPAAPGALYAPYVSSPAEADVVISGNPYLEARITSDWESGVVAAALWDLPPGFSCVGGAPSGEVPNLIMAPGQADLHYYATGVYRVA